MSSAANTGALAIAIAFAVIVSASLLASYRTRNRRQMWLVAGVLALFFMAIGSADLLREEPRETSLATVFVGVALPVLGCVGLIQATYRMRARYRVPLVFLTALVLLFTGLLVGAALLPKLLSAL